MEENKAMMRRMVEGINAGEIESTVHELFAPRAARYANRACCSDPGRLGWRNWSEYGRRNPLRSFGPTARCASSAVFLSPTA